MDNCIFCKIANGTIPSKKIYEDEKVIVFMDIHPVCDGHLLIIPKKHFNDVFELPEDLLAHMYKIAKIMINKTMKIGLEQGASINFNYGSRQEIKHVHMHILPNYAKKVSKEVNVIYENLIKA